MSEAASQLPTKPLNTLVGFDLETYQIPLDPLLSSKKVPKAIGHSSAPMIRRAIDRGVSKERLARAFNVNLSSINRRINLLSGICPEANALLKATPPEQRADVPPP